MMPQKAMIETLAECRSLLLSIGVCPRCYGAAGAFKHLGHCRVQTMIDRIANVLQVWTPTPCLRCGAYEPLVRCLVCQRRECKDCRKLYSDHNVVLCGDAWCTQEARRLGLLPPVARLDVTHINRNRFKALPC